MAGNSKWKEYFALVFSALLLLETSHSLLLLQKKIDNNLTSVEISMIKDHNIENATTIEDSVAGRLEITSASLAVNEGDAANFLCRDASGSGNVRTLTWFRADGRPLPRTVIEDGRGSMIIKSAEISDAGNYVCRGFLASLRVVTATATLTVQQESTDLGDIVAMNSFEVGKVRDKRWMAALGKYLLRGWRAARRTIVRVFTSRDVKLLKSSIVWGLSLECLRVVAMQLINCGSQNFSNCQRWKDLKTQNEKINEKANKLKTKIDDIKNISTLIDTFANSLDNFKYTVYALKFIVENSKKKCRKVEIPMLPSDVDSQLPLVDDIITDDEESGAFSKKTYFALTALEGAYIYQFMAKPFFDFRPIASTIASRGRQCVKFVSKAFTVSLTLVCLVQATTESKNIDARYDEVHTSLEKQEHELSIREKKIEEWNAVAVAGLAKGGQKVKILLIMLKKIVQKLVTMQPDDAELNKMKETCDQLLSQICSCSSGADFSKLKDNKDFAEDLEDFSNKTLSKIETWEETIQAEVNIQNTAKYQYIRGSVDNDKDLESIINNLKSQSIIRSKKEVCLEIALYFVEKNEEVKSYKECGELGQYLQNLRTCLVTTAPPGKDYNC